MIRQNAGLSNLQGTPPELLPLFNSKVERQKLLVSLVQRATLLYGILLLTILPWTIRNFFSLGDFVLVSTNGGVNLLIGNNPHATGTYIWNESIRSLAQEYTGDPNRSNEVVFNQNARHYAISYIITHPLQTISLFKEKICFTYCNILDGFLWNVEEIHLREVQILFVRLYFVSTYFYAILIIGFIAGAILTTAHSKENIFACVGIIIALYFTLICMVFFGTSRFHFPLIPWFAMYAAVYFHSLFKTLRSLMSKRKLLSG